jgi:hypothetical protein
VGDPALGNGQFVPPTFGFTGAQRPAFAIHPAHTHGRYIPCMDTLTAQAHRDGPGIPVRVLHLVNSTAEFNSHPLANGGAQPRAAARNTAITDNDVDDPPLPRRRKAYHFWCADHPLGSDGRNAGWASVSAEAKAPYKLKEAIAQAAYDTALQVRMQSKRDKRLRYWGTLHT